MIYFIAYLAAINIITFIIYGMDKYKARKHKWRISEKELMGLSVIGGFIGAFAGMQIFRHKTKHMKFVVGVPVIAALWITAIGCYMWLLYK
ncbi:MAG: DUF1294 domain-containing protein [Eubacterium sp.]